MIVGFCGAAGSGKDTAASALIEHEGYEKESFAGPLKDVLNEIFGWHMSNWDDPDWKETPNACCYGRTPREVAQTLGTDWGRNMVNEDIWVDMALSQGGIDGYDLVFTDVRFPNEAKGIRRNGGILIFVECNDRPTTTSRTAHASELWLPWLKKYADERIAAPYGQIDYLKRAARFTLAEFVEGNRTRYLTPDDETLAEMMVLEADINRQIAGGAA